MAIEIKTLGQASPANANNADLYAVGAGKAAVVSTLSITNVSASAAKARVFIRLGGAVASQSNALVYDTSIAANSTQGLTLGITLAATDVITVNTNVASALTFMAFGQENS